MTDKSVNNAGTQFKWNGPTKVIIELDPDDLRDVLAAANKRLATMDMPDGESCRLGGAIAEVCRGWLGYMDTVPARI